MKVIVSHDVDHLTVLEHRGDLVLPKFIVRRSLELITRRISAGNYFSIFPELLSNKWQYLEEIMEFDRQKGIPATFFIGVETGHGLAYGKEFSVHWIKKILERGFHVGVHGIRYNKYEDVMNEYIRFRNISNLSKFGIRTHYLRMAPDTLKIMNKVGYQYDSSYYGLVSPWKIDHLIEFPLCIMDVRVFYNGRRCLPKKFNKAKEITRELIDRANNIELPFLTLLFHDRYFCSAFGEIRDWYYWVIEYLQEGGFQFTNYQLAIGELENTYF